MAEWRTDWKVGDKPYVFHENRRRYDANRHIIYREHFEQREITGETTRSWLVGALKTTKIPKKTGANLYTADMVELEVWGREHKYKIAEALRYSSIPLETFKKIAELIGYKAST